MTESDEAAKAAELLQRCRHVVAGLEEFAEVRFRTPVPIEGQWRAAAVGRAFAIYRSMCELAASGCAHSAVGALARELALNWLASMYLEEFGNDGAKRMWRSNIRAMRSIAADIGQAALWAKDPPDMSWPNGPVTRRELLTPPEMFHEFLESANMDAATKAYLEDLWVTVYVRGSHFSAHPSMSAASTHYLEATAGHTTIGLVPVDGPETVRMSLGLGTTLLLMIFERFPASPAMAYRVSQVADACEGRAPWPVASIAKSRQVTADLDVDEDVLAEYLRSIERTEALFPIRSPNDARSTWVEASNARVAGLARGTWHLIAAGVPDLAGVVFRSQLEWVYALNYATFGPADEAGRALWRSSVAQESDLPANIRSGIANAEVPAHWNQPPIRRFDKLSANGLLELSVAALRSHGHEDAATQLQDSYRAFRIASETSMHCTPLALETFLLREPSSIVGTTRTRIAIPTDMFVSQSNLFVDGLFSLLVQHRAAEAERYVESNRDGLTVID